MLATQVAHKGSKPTGFEWYFGKILKRVSLSKFTSFTGRPGRSLQPETVLFSITEQPNKASLASFTAKVPILDSVFNFEYFSKVLSMVTSPSVHIILDGFDCDLPVKGIGPVMFDDASTGGGGVVEWGFRVVGLGCGMGD